MSDLYKLQKTVNGAVSDEAYDQATWDGVTKVAPSKNAVRDKIETINTRIETLETNNEIYEIYENIGAGTSGTVTIPTGATILLDRYEDAGDCIITKADSANRPIDDIAREASGAVITSTFDGSGNYSLSGTPSSYPVCIIFQVVIAASDAANITASQVVDKFEFSDAVESYYDNNSANLSSTDVQNAIDEIQTNNPYIEFDNGLANPSHAEGRVFYDNTKKALSYYNEEADVTVNMGQEVVFPVWNDTGSLVPNGTIVYPAGIDAGSGLPTFGIADASEKDKCRLVGLVTHDIENGSRGYVTRLGSVGGLNTAGLSGILYLSATTPGAYTMTKPDDGAFITTIGAVGIADAANGTIIVDPRTSELAVEVTDTNGFATGNRFNTTLAFDDGTRTFTIAPKAPATDFHYYVVGEKFEKTSSDSVVITDVEGVHCIYYDGSTLTSLANPTDAQFDNIIRTKAIVSILYYDASNAYAIFLLDERHGISMAPDTHSYLHFTVGAKYLSGLALNNLVTDQSGDLATHAQFGIDSGFYTDEDLVVSSDAILSTTGLPIYYLEGATPNLRRTTLAGYSVLTDTAAGVDTTGRLVYNQFTGGLYQLTVVPNNDFVLCHVLAINGDDGTDQIVAIIGQEYYVTRSQARAGAETEIANIVTLIPSPEIVPVATVIFQTSDGYANPVKARTWTTDTGDDYVNWTTTEMIPGSTPSSHNNLANLELANTGVTYGHIDDQAQSIYGAKTFINTLTTADASLDGNVTINEAGADKDFRVESAVNSNAFFLRGSDGNIGIRTAAPNYNLEVYDNNSDNYIYATISGDYLSGLGIRRINGSAYTNADWVQIVSSDGYFQLKDETNDTFPIIVEPNTPTNTLYIDSAGKIGIGTNAPNSPLEIQTFTVASSGATAFNRIASFYSNDSSENQEFHLGVLPTNVDTILRFAGGDGSGTFGKGYFLQHDKGNNKFHIGTNTGGNIDSDSYDITLDSSGQVGIGTDSPSQAFDLIGSMELEDTTTSTSGVIFKDTVSFMHNFHHPTGNTAVPNGGNVFIGESAGNFTTGSTATNVSHSSYNIAIGKESMENIRIGFENVAIGFRTLRACQDGAYNLAFGTNALVAGTASRNIAMGAGSLQNFTSGANSIAIGYNSGRYITSGAVNQTSSESIYIGRDARGSADGNTNEIVIGDSSRGAGSNSVTLGNTSITKTLLNGAIGVGVSPLTNMAAGDMVLEGGSLVLKEITTPTADANYGKIYTKSDNKLYFQDGAGTEHEIQFV